MTKIDLYNQKGEKQGEITVSDVIFTAKFNKGLVHQALLRQLSNARPGVYAHTKTKAEVRGGGRKPFRQKGTGKARQGSIRNPHWIGGGVAFGPRNIRNFQKNMPKKQRRQALFSALSLKLAENNIIALDKYEADKINTQAFMKVLQALPFEKDVLIVLPAKNKKIEKSSHNLPFTKTILVNYLNIADLQKYEHILFIGEESVKKLEEIFLPTE